MVEPDDHWAAFQKTVDAALVQRVAALELNEAVKPYREWIIDPRWYIYICIQLQLTM